MAALNVVFASAGRLMVTSCRLATRSMVERPSSSFVSVAWRVGRARRGGSMTSIRWIRRESNICIRWRGNKTRRNANTFGNVAGARRGLCRWRSGVAHGLCGVGIVGGTHSGIGHPLGIRITSAALHVASVEHALWNSKSRSCGTGSVEQGKAGVRRRGRAAPRRTARSNLVYTGTIQTALYPPKTRQNNSKALSGID